jgi:hypothetical protein
MVDTKAPEGAEILSPSPAASKPKTKADTTTETLIIGGAESIRPFSFHASDEELC